MDHVPHILRPGVELRPVEAHHATAIWDRVERNRTHLREWLPWVDNSKSVADVEVWIDSQLKMYAASEGYAAGIWIENEFAGVLGTHPINRTYRKVELGYWLAREFVGRGIITAATRALTTHAIRRWGLNRVEIYCAVGNERSSAIPRRLGFVEEGIHREAQLLNGRFVDIRIFSMLAKDWKPESAS